MLTLLRHKSFLLVAAAATVAVAAGGVSAGTVAASCSTASASAAATAAGFGVEPVLGRTPINSVVCGPLFGAGTQGMAATVAVPTGCGFSIGWGVFRLEGDTWRLVMKQDNGVLKLEVVGSDIRTTQGYPLRGDPRCSPSRMRSQVWHWNGSSFVATPWTVTQAETVYFARFRSPSGNLACEFGAGHIRGVECVSVKPARLVFITTTGKAHICLRYGDPCLFSVKIFTDGSAITAAPVLQYGHKALGSGLGSGFSCDSEKIGMICRRGAGAGFLINSAGIKRVG